MDDYISRKSALDVMCDSCSARYSSACISGDKCYSYGGISNIPAADVRPVVRGTWIDMGDFISCSSCKSTRLKEFESYYGKTKRLDVRTNYCHNCGADMRKKEAGTDKP